MVVGLKFWCCAFLLPLSKGFYHRFFFLFFASIISFGFYCQCMSISVQLNLLHSLHKMHKQFLPFRGGRLFCSQFGTQIVTISFFSTRRRLSICLRPSTRQKLQTKLGIYVHLFAMFPLLITAN